MKSSAKQVESERKTAEMQAVEVVRSAGRRSGRWQKKEKFCNCEAALCEKFGEF